MSSSSSLLPRTWAASIGLLLLPSLAFAGRLLELPNGSQVLIRPGDGPPALTWSVAVGSDHDPPDAPGLAEWTLRGLMLGTVGSPSAERLEARIAAVAARAEPSPGPRDSRLRFADATELEDALALGVEMLAEPRLPAGDFLHLKLRMAREQVASEGGLEALRDEARQLLSPAGAASGVQELTAVLAFEKARAVEFHRRHYRPDALRVVLEGTLPESESLDPMLYRTVGAWQAPTEPAPAAPARARPSADHRPVRVQHGAAPGLAVAFPASEEPLATAAVLASVAAELGGDWSLRADAGSGAALLGTEVGEPLVLAGPGEPAAAWRSVERLLERAARRGLRRGSLADAEQVLTSAEGAGAVLALAPPPRSMAEVRASPLPEPASAWQRPERESLARAAQALRDGPRAVAAVSAAEAAAARFAKELGAPPPRAVGEPGDAVQRELAREGRRWVDRAVAAHGGPALTELRRVAAVGTRLARLGEARRPLGVQRLDLDLESLHARQETRPISQRVQVHVVSYDGETAYVDTPQGRRPQSPLGSLAFHGQFRRHPLVLLQSAASSRSHVRSLGWSERRGRRVHEVELVDPAVGVTTMAFDAESGLLVAAEFDNRVPRTSAPVRMRLVFSEHAPTAAGVVLHRSEELMLDDETERGNLWAPIDWLFPSAEVDPLEIEELDDELRLPE